MAKDAPLWFMFSTLTWSSWQRHRPRLTHWETIGVGLVEKGVPCVSEAVPAGAALSGGGFGVLAEKVDGTIPHGMRS